MSCGKVYAAGVTDLEHYEVTCTDEAPCSECIMQDPRNLATTTYVLHTGELLGEIRDDIRDNITDRLSKPAPK